MALPSSPPISLSDILTELGRYSAGQSLSGASDERSLSGIASGAISFSDYLGKSSFTIEKINPDGTGNYTIGVLDTGQAVLVSLAYLITGTSGTLVSLRIDGQLTTIENQYETVNDPNTVGVAFGIYTGTHNIHGPVAQSSSTGTGSSTHADVYVITNYNGVKATAKGNTTIATVAGKAALVQTQDNNAAPTLTYPTDGSSISLGATNRAAISFL